MEALVKLLEYLDPDAEIAGGKYENERRSLIRYFEGRGVLCPDELADATFDRVAQKLAGSEKVSNFGAYCHTVAQWILKEHWKRVAITAAPSEEFDLTKIIAANPADAAAKELLSICLDHCLEKLSPDTRQIIIEYYSADRRNRINARQALANRLGINREALSNRAQRLRDKLEECIKNCCARKE